MNADRDYFNGCHNVPMFDTMDDDALDRHIAESAGVGHAVTLADVVRAIDARRIVNQLELPAELLPRADGCLFG